MLGIDGIPWQSRNVLKDGRLVIRRATDESGQLLIPWPVPGHGQLALSTASLRETERPYNLPVELARGTVGRLRDQVEAWRQSGFQFSGEVADRLRAATRAFGRAATSQARPLSAADAAESAMLEALDTIDLVSAEYAHHAIKLRKQHDPKLNVLLAANLGPSAADQLPEETGSLFNTAMVPFSWSEVEGTVGGDQSDKYAAQVKWCRSRGLRVCGGPLLNFHRDCLPDWLYLWEDDFDSLQSYMVRYVETVVQQFLGKVNLWHCWAGLNCGEAMAMSEEFRLRVAVASLEALRRIDPTSPVIVSFDQPWGEYLGRQSFDLAPLHYADTLIRAGLGLSGLGLEINLGYWPHGSLPRDLLEIGRLLDRWSLFGLPLVVFLTMPSRSDADPQAKRQVQVLSMDADQVNPNTQAALLGPVIELCLAKPSVQGIVWNQLQDQFPHPYPHGGLYDHQGHEKPIVETLRAVRRNHFGD